MIKDFFKKQSIAFYIAPVTVILSIIAVSIYGHNSGLEYFNDYKGSVVALAVVSIFLQVASVVGPQFLKGRIFDGLFSVTTILSCVFLMMSVMFFLGDRVYDMAIILGSDLEAGNAAAQSAMSNAIAGIVIYFIAIILNIVSAFFRVKKETPGPAFKTVEA